MTDELPLQKVIEQGRLPAPRWEVKVWGRAYHAFSSSQAAFSYLEVEAGFRCSKHYHVCRANQFTVLTGAVAVEVFRHGAEPALTLLVPGRSLTVPSLVSHRFRVLETGTMIEVYWPEHGGEVRSDDIVRMDVGGPDDAEELERLLRRDRQEVPNCSHDPMWC